MSRICINGDGEVGSIQPSDCFLKCSIDELLTWHCVKRFLHELLGEACQYISQGPCGGYEGREEAATLLYDAVNSRMSRPLHTCAATRQCIQQRQGTA